MKKILEAIAMLAVATMVLGLSSCGLLSVSGVVVNVQAPSTQEAFYKGDGTATLIGSIITMTDQSSGKVLEGTVGSDGSYLIDGVGAGRYLVEGARDGWSFVPRVVDISGFLTSLPAMLAYETPADLDQVLIMVEWQNLDYDVDSYMVRDLTDDGDMNGTVICDWQAPSSDTYVKLDRDVTEKTDAAIPRVETMRVIGNSANPELLRYYIKLYIANTPGTLTGDNQATTNKNPANATVFVMQGETHLGTYPIAYNSAEAELGVVAMEWDNAKTQWNIGSYGGAWSLPGGARSVGNGVVLVDEMN